VSYDRDIGGTKESVSHLCLAWNAVPHADASEGGQCDKVLSKIWVTIEDVGAVGTSATDSVKTDLIRLAAATGSRLLLILAAIVAVTVTVAEAAAAVMAVVIAMAAAVAAATDSAVAARVVAAAVPLVAAAVVVAAVSTACPPRSLALARAS
jgi:hypothetical protein